MAAITRSVRVCDIRIDGGTQSRKGLSDEAVQSYAEAWKAGEQFPACVVYEDPEGTLWLSEGFHRIAGATVAKIKSVTVEVRRGTQRDALRNSLASNRTNGLLRTNADKRFAVEIALKDEEWSKWSNVKVAELCGVSDMTVKRIRDELSSTKLRMHTFERTAERNGTRYSMQFSKVTEKAIEAAAEPEQANGILAHEEPEPPAKAEAPACPGKDKLGIPLTEETAKVFAVKPEFQALRKLFWELRKELDRVARLPGGDELRRHLQLTGDTLLSRHLENALSEVNFSEPFSSVCPSCYYENGDPHEAKTNCRQCRGRGWCVKDQFERGDDRKAAAVRLLAHEEAPCN